MSASTGWTVLSLTCGARWLVVERWHPIPEGTVGALGLDQPTGTSCCLQLSNSQMGLCPTRARKGLYQQQGPTYSLLRAELLGWSTGAPCAQRLCPTDLQSFSAQCHVPSTTARRHLPLPGPKGILQEPHKGAKGDLPGGEFSITSA